MRKPMREYAWLVVLAVTLSCPAVRCAADEIVTDTFEYEINYDPDDPSDRERYTSDRDARSIARQFDASGGTGVHHAYLDLGFREPDFYDLGNRDVDLEPGAGSGNALLPWRIVLTPEALSVIGHDTIECTSLCIHELHHMVQYEYIPYGTYYLSLYPIASEGPAVAMEDGVVAGADDGPFNNKWYMGFYQYAEIYLDGRYDVEVAYDTYLWGTGKWPWSAGGYGYATALFWKYLMEQFGTERSEPAVGMDFLKRFYVLADANRQGLLTTLQDTLDEKDRQTTAEYDPGVELEEAFRDFTIANWVRRYRNPLPYAAGYTVAVADAARFYYVDEDPATCREAIYDATSLTNVRPLADRSYSLTPIGTTGIQTGDVENCAASYVSCTFGSCTTRQYAVGFWAQSYESAGAVYSLIGRRHNGVIDLIRTGTVHPDPGNAFSYAVMQDPTNWYEELVAVVNGLSTRLDGGFTMLHSPFTYSFGYIAPDLDILEPNSNYRAFLGEWASPERFIVKLMVSSTNYLGTGSIKGLAAEDFTVYVGSALNPSNRAEVISAAYVMGEYWLTVEAPPLAAPSAVAFPITVYLGSVADTEEGAVVYAPLAVSQMLVIDRSGSMATMSGGTRRIDGARAAAQLFVDASGSDDKIGTVRFSGNMTEVGDTNYLDGEVFTPMLSTSNQWVRDLVNLALDETNPGGDMLIPSGWTSIGDGLYWGAKELVDHGDPEAEKWIILLSDGYQNEASDFSAQKAFLTGIGAHVETIALGPGCDKNLLQSIADQTGGRYYEVAALDDGSSFSAPSKVAALAGGSSSLLLDIADAYLQTSERIHRRERLMDEQGLIAAGAAREYTLELAAGGLVDAVASLFAAASGSGLGLSIRRPDGTGVPAPDSGYAGSTDPSGHYWDPDFYVLYRLAAMTNGVWTFIVTNSGSADASYALVVSGKDRQGVSSALYFTQFHGDSAVYAQNGVYLRGLPMPIVAVLSDGHGPVRRADVTVTVTHPDRPVTVLRLRDDGGEYDGTGGDGVYAARFAATTESSASGGGYAEETPPVVTGSYHATLQASGTDNLGRPFSIVRRGTFHIYDSQESDSDHDDMPDRYEVLHRGLDPTLKDDTADSDKDGLINFDEYMRGTDPSTPDTDAGGENDRSEVDHGGNPLDYTDDAVPAVGVAGVLCGFNDVLPPEWATNAYPQPNQNIITFSVERGVESVELFRSTNPTSSFVKVATVATSTNGGFYIDSGLVNGTTYYYYMIPQAAGGRCGVPSRRFEGTPQLDNSPPAGTVEIEDGRRSRPPIWSPCGSTCRRTRWI